MASINHSLEWSTVEQQLSQHIKQMGTSDSSLQRMCKNIGGMVSELSKEEIACRRLGRQTLKHRELLEKINKEIVNLEQMITFGTLLGRK